MDLVLLQISPGATAEALSSKTRYPRFLRTIAPDGIRGRALVAVLKGLRWTYVSLAHDETTRSLGMLKVLEELLYEGGVCIATKVSLVGRNTAAGDHYDSVVTVLSHFKGAVGVIVLSGPDKLRNLFQAVKRKNAIGRFVFIGTDQWGGLDYVTHDLADVLRGSLIIVPDSNEDLYFDMFMRRLTPDSDPHNPWLKEFWQDFFKCDLEFGAGYGVACSGKERLGGATFSSNPYAINTINAVYSYAYGLTKLFRERCGDMIIPPCDALSGGDKTSELVYEYIRNIMFTGADGKTFQFTKTGDGSSSFRIMNYQLDTSGKQKHYYEQVILMGICLQSYQL